MRRTGNRPLERLWRLPAGLSALAFLALPAWVLLDHFAAGTFARETLVFVPRSLWPCGHAEHPSPPRPAPAWGAQSRGADASADASKVAEAPAMD